MKKILGLDLGTNSIGWSLIEHDFDKKEGKILGMGSRIIPMSKDIMDKFGSGQSHSQTAERTDYRGTRRLYQRDNLRRERLHRVLNVLGFLPGHYVDSIDFENRLGQFYNNREVKLNYKPFESNGNLAFEFLFKDSFLDMVSEFKEKHPELFHQKENGEEAKIPYDWTIYYLRKKALTEKITEQELAWIILNFNQKRGYYQLRGEEEETDNTKSEEFYSLRVYDVEETEDKNANGTWHNVILENGWIYRRQSKESLKSWNGKIKEFIITTQLDENGNPKVDKEGDVKRSFRAVDSEKDWIAIKKKTEQDIGKSEKTVGFYIYESLLKSPKQKIRGKLVKTIERKFYKQELNKILEVQTKFHDKLKDKDLYRACVEELYPRNEAHQQSIIDKGFVYLFLNDIIFYQRPLKSQKSNIAGCTYETRTFKKDVDGKKEIVTEAIKAIPKSHPLFQEFRLWQFLQNLKIYQKEALIDGKTQIDYNVTDTMLANEDDWIAIFDYLNTRKEVEQKHIIEHLVKQGKITKKEKDNYRWNYVEDKTYPANTTKAQFVSRLKKVEGVNADEILTDDFQQALWHIIYSITDKAEFEKALKKFAEKNCLDVNSFFEAFQKFPPFDSEYGAYSLKALKKLLPVMRRGKYWNEHDISEEVIRKAESIRERLDAVGFQKTKIDETVSDDEVQKQVLRSFADFSGKNMVQGLNTYQACYLVYGRHSEAVDTTKWEIPDNIDAYLQKFKQHSLRNPIVEQVVTETLRVVRDIWQYYGNGDKNFFKEIHIELGREMKNPADKRKQIAARQQENENTNQRIKQILTELMNDSAVEGDVRPHSPSHQEVLKIYEEGIYQNPNADYKKVNQDEIEKIRKTAKPSAKDITRYKLWLEQGYRSPYTGEMISLGKLFTTAYQIEHIIPQARYFDDSLSNKIICESEVNQLKSNMTAYEFIKDKGGSVVDLQQGKTVKIFDLSTYEENCNQYFKKNKTKLKKLLSEDIPEGFIERQMNDSRYISKLIKGLLSNIVKDDDEQAATSKYVVPVTGAITDKLKQDWGLHDKWNEIVAPRFIRMNEITKSQDYGYFDDTITAFRITVPDELQRGFNKKRIDHRHHAMDALVIACADRRHIQYLNALNNEKENFALRDSLLLKNKNDHYTKTFQMPWHNFPNKAKDALEKTVVSFKQNLRVINKTTNKTWQWIEKDGKLKKQLVKQTRGDSWAIRKPMHKDTVSGRVNIRIRNTVSFANGIKNWKNLVDKNLKSIINELIDEGKDTKAIANHFKDYPYLINGDPVKQVEIYTYTANATATKTMLTENFTRKQLESVTDSGIKKILENHIKNYIDEKGNERFDIAFCTDGIAALNENIEELNNGKKHQPVYSVRLYEEGNKFNVGYSGNKASKFVEAAKGTNLFFAIYWNEEKQKREYETIPLNVIIEHQKQVAHLPKEERTPVPLNNEKGLFLFSLSPNNLVYVPTVEEIENPSLFKQNSLTDEHLKHIYKTVSSSGTQCFFVQCCVADTLANKIEFSALNKMEKSIDDIMIKDVCWKLEVDRIGNITKVIR
ncbi:MAG: type II CRISPR RNA-guided endonuclease Cas9 [Bacteroidales bacterium]|nr:type II CRISPR RNA-guided endonuclease Cas9 [Bacteroidales bacterium]MBN2821475.1 type II CRISPR RNA-guided endonuclease Cas9 [Bacteroidales bacterium]